MIINPPTTPSPEPVGDQGGRRIITNVNYKLINQIKFVGPPNKTKGARITLESSSGSSCLLDNTMMTTKRGPAKALPLFR